MLAILKNAVNLIKGYSPFLKQISSFHILSQPNAIRNQFLAPVVYELTPICGMKVKGKPRRRCKDCYVVFREQRMYILCKTHRRHKQMSIVKDPKNTWILTHATQGKIRQW